MLHKLISPEMINRIKPIFVSWCETSVIICIYNNNLIYESCLWQKEMFLFFLLLSSRDPFIRWALSVAYFVFECWAKQKWMKKRFAIKLKLRIQRLPNICGRISSNILIFVFVSVVILFYLPVDSICIR